MAWAEPVTLVLVLTGRPGDTGSPGTEGGRGQNHSEVPGQRPPSAQILNPAQPGARLRRSRPSPEHIKQPVGTGLGRGGRMGPFDVPADGPKRANGDPNR
ncbi:unnamed protein product [Gadus morhua 'NCC']